MSISTDNIQLKDFVKSLEDDLLNINQKTIEHLDNNLNENQEITKKNINLKHKLIKDYDIFLYICLFFILNHEKIILFFNDKIPYNLYVRCIIFGIIIYIIKYTK